MRNFIIRLVASFFFIGYLPLIPGTFGSVAGIFLFYLVKESFVFYLCSVFILLALGFLVSGEAEKMLGKKDARQIVIDEACGIFITFLFIPYNLKLMIVGFFLFRLLDTLKPYPAGRLQGLKGSKGIMIDDIIAALYANIILQVVARFTSFIAS